MILSEQSQRCIRSAAATSSRKSLWNTHGSSTQAWAADAALVAHKCRHEDPQGSSEVCCAAKTSLCKPFKSNAVIAHIERCACVKLYARRDHILIKGR